MNQITKIRIVTKDIPQKINSNVESTCTRIEGLYMMFVLILSSESTTCKMKTIKITSHDSQM